MIKILAGAAVGIVVMASAGLTFARPYFTDVLAPERRFEVTCQVTDDFERSDLYGLVGFGGVSQADANKLHVGITYECGLREIVNGERR